MRKNDRISNGDHLYVVGTVLLFIAIMSSFHAWKKKKPEKKKKTDSVCVCVFPSRSIPFCFFFVSKMHFGVFNKHKTNVRVRTSELMRMMCCLARCRLKLIRQTRARAARWMHMLRATKGKRWTKITLYVFQSEKALDVYGIKGSQSNKTNNDSSKVK